MTAFIDGSVVQIDAADLHLLSSGKWAVNDHAGYLYAHIGKRVYLHRMIVAAPKGAMVDHANGDTLDNRRQNLRLATNSQNQANRLKLQKKHGFRGVCWHRQFRKYQAGIKVNGKSVHLGLYDSAESAARAYDAAAREHFGEFGYQNFKDGAA